MSELIWTKRMSKLIWTPNQIPLGATVFLVPPDSDEPAVVDGKPIPFRTLYGGIAKPGKKLYPLPFNQSPRGSIITTQIDLDSFRQGVRFSPVQTYTPGNAPVDGKYAVFDGEERRLDGEYPLEVAKVDDGAFYASSGFPFKAHQLSGNPAFESSLPRQETTDDGLVGLIEHQLQSIQTLQQIGWKETDVSTMKFGLTQTVEALARRHRSTPSDLVGVFSRFGTSYLKQTSLPATAQLVRTDKEDTYMPRVAVQTSA